MGIKGLTNYFKFRRDNAESIGIIDEIENWRIKHGGRIKPKIVIDLKEFVHSVVQRDIHGMVLGGRFDLYNQILRRFFENLSKTNADLVFFLAGQKVIDDLPLHIPRHERKYVDRLEVLDEIERECDLREYVHVSDKVHKRASIAFDYNITQMCPTFGEFHVTLVRHNQEIAQYAQKHAEVLAIITNDTDFLAFEGEFQYWQANYINFRDFKVVRFDRNGLIKSLGVSIHQLQLMSALSGGSYLPCDQSTKFCKKFPAIIAKTYTENFFGRLELLSLYAKQHPVINKTTNNGVRFNLEPIANDLFGPNYTTLELNSIHNALMTYDTDFASDDDEEYRNDYISLSSQEQILFINFCKKNCTFMYLLMMDKVYKVHDIEYIDYRNFHSKNYAELIIPMLMKLCGILYSDSSPRRRTRRICMKYAHDEPAKVVDENIIYPEERLPRLFDLIFKSSERKYINQRWSLLRWVLDFDEAFIQSISTNASIDKYKYLPTILALKSLLQNKEITAHEANMIMFTEIETRININNYNKFDYARYPNVRYVRIAHLYVYIYKWMNHCLDVCGLHFKTDLIRFNGPKFHANISKYDLNDAGQTVEIKKMIESICYF